METCDRCGGWFDPAAGEGVQQADLFTPKTMKLCDKCYDQREKAAREAERMEREAREKGRE